LKCFKFSTLAIVSAHPNTPQSYSIQKAAELSGLPASTLRYYETIGLMPPIDRDASSGHRRYCDDDIDHAIAIACLNATGMSVEDMRAYLAQHGPDARAAGQQIELLERHRQHLGREAQVLQLRQRYIEVKIAYWRAVASGDEVQVQAITERARAISEELRGTEEMKGTSTDS
jgi:DNA-binding transcriptional MerR regulator